MKHHFPRRLGALALALVLTLSLAVTPAWAAPAGEPTLNDYFLGLNVGDTYSLSLGSYYPPNYAYYQSSDPAVATVDNTGTITAVAEGQAQIEIRGPGRPMSCDVLVGSASSSIPPLSLPSPYEVPLNSSRTLMIISQGSPFSYYPYYPAQLTWTSSNPAIADIRQIANSAVEIYGKSEGTANIIVTGPDGSHACVVTVKDNTVYPTGITLNDTAVTMQLAADSTTNVTHLLKSTVQPADAVGDVKWSTSDKTIVNVSETGTVLDNRNARIVARGAGTATITATIKDKNGNDLKATCTVTVKPYKAVDSIGLDRLMLSLKAGESETLVATVAPSDATDADKVTWSSDKPNVADVDQNGVVTAKSAGTATITAAVDGQTATCPVTVTAAPSSLTVEPTYLPLAVGKTGKLKATTVPDNAVVTWTSSNTSVATVSASGKEPTITARGKGSATITGTMTYKGETFKKTCAVVVTDGTSIPVTKITLNETSKSLPVGDNSFRLTATVEPANADVKTVTWSSSNDNIATVDANGNIKAVGPGKAVITCTPDYGERVATCEITVTPAATGIRMNPDTNVTIESDSSGKQKYTLLFRRTSRSDSVVVNTTLIAADSKDSVLWKSSDSTIATVTGTGTSATVTRQNPGVTTITAVPVGPDGKPREGVTPAELEVTVSGITLPSTFTLAENRQDSLDLKAYGDAVTNDAPQWLSSNSAVVAVDTNGRLTARSASAGPTAVVSASKSGYTANCTVTVVEDASGIITLTGNHPAGSPVNMATTSATSQAGSGTLASVLEQVCREKTKVLNSNGTYTTYGLQYVTNLSVASTDQGILHDQHHSSSDTGAGVGVQEIYYPNANTSQGQRSLKDLSFVPRTTFSGTAEINYSGRSTNNQTFTGVIRVSVNGTGDVMYSSSEGSVVHFVADDFNLYHPSLRSVSFTPPLESRGTLYYNYSSASQPGTKVKASDSYNRTGTPSLDRVVFVPASGYEGTVTISYKGTDTSGRSITGTVTISVTNNRGSAGEPGDIYYSQWGSQATFWPTDFANASWRVLGESLSYVRFNLPPSSEGTLFYNYRGPGNYDSTVSSTANYYYSGSPSLSGVSFVPTTTSPSQADISYTGYTTRGNTFTGTIHIGQVNGDAASHPNDPSVCSGTTASPIPLSSSRMRSICNGTLSGELSYITFTSLPDATQGKLYQGYSHFGTGTLVDTSTRYYVTGSTSKSPTIDQISFVPKGRFNGRVSVGYTATNTNGKSVTGFITFNITSTGNSNYFNDMGGYTWAAPAVDYLYQNGVTKGISATSYGPGQNILRRDFVLMLCRAFQLSGGSGYSFADVPTNAYYADAVATAKRLGIVNGNGGNFMPNSPITRQDAMVMVKNALKAAGRNVESASTSILDRFPDGASVSSYARDAVSALVQIGAVNGANGMLNPRNSITRAEAAMILHFVMTM